MSTGTGTGTGACSGAGGCPVTPSVQNGLSTTNKSFAGENMKEEFFSVMFARPFIELLLTYTLRGHSVAEFMRCYSFTEACL